VVVATSGAVVVATSRVVVFAPPFVGPGLVVAPSGEVVVATSGEAVVAPLVVAPPGDMVVAPPGEVVVAASGEAVVAPLVAAPGDMVVGAPGAGVVAPRVVVPSRLRSHQFAEGSMASRHRPTARKPYPADNADATPATANPPMKYFEFCDGDSAPASIPASAAAAPMKPSELTTSSIGATWLDVQVFGFGSELTNATEQPVARNANASDLIRPRYRAPRRVRDRDATLPQLARSVVAAKIDHETSGDRRSATTIETQT
jgi:hypothetical protein